MAETEMPIFTRTFDLLSWLVPATNDFPRAHRHSATRRLLDTGGQPAPRRRMSPGSG